MQTVDRAGWNARPPRYTNPLNWAAVTEFIVHYSGAARAQTVRSIQDYSMDVKGYSDIDYNALVKDGIHYVGRGDNIGGHTLNHNSRSYGVCIIGNDGDATDADFRTVRELYEMACGKAGRQLAKLGHLDANPGQTDCPGSEIEAWVRAGMPGGNMTDLDYGSVWPKPTVAGDRPAMLMIAELWAEIHLGQGAYGGDGFVLRQLARIESALKALAVEVPPIDYEKLAEALMRAGVATAAGVRDAVADGLEGGSGAVRADS